MKMADGSNMSEILLIQRLVEALIALNEEPLGDKLTILTERTNLRDKLTASATIVSQPSEITYCPLLIVTEHLDQLKELVRRSMYTIVVSPKLLDSTFTTVQLKEFIRSPMFDLANDAKVRKAITEKPNQL